MSVAVLVALLDLFLDDARLPANPKDGSTCENDEERVAQDGGGHKRIHWFPFILDERSLRFKDWIPSADAPQ